MINSNQPNKKPKVVILFWKTYEQVTVTSGLKKKKRANFYELSSQVWTEGDCTPSRAESFLDMFHRLSHNQTFMETPLNNLGYFTVLKLKLAFQLADEAFGFVRALLSTRVYSVSLAGALCRQGKQWG